VARTPDRAETTPAAAFDVIGTLVTLEAPRRRLVELGLPAYALDLWFAEALRDYFARSHAGAYTPMKDMLQATLPRTLASFERFSGAGDAGPVLEALTQLEPAPGAAQACGSLVESGWRLFAVTNASEETTRHLLGRAGLESFFSGVVSCDELRVSKPHPDVYAAAVRRAGRRPWMVAAHAWDVMGAKEAGLRTAWIKTKERLYPRAFPAPDVVAGDLVDAAAQLVLAG
jgi:2-haloacid dehalogenase